MQQLFFLNDIHKLADGKRLLDISCNYLYGHIMQSRTKESKTDSLEQAEGAVFVTVSAVAAALGYSARTVRRLLEKGHLPGQKIGAGWRMHRDDFAKLTAPQLTDTAA